MGKTLKIALALLYAVQVVVIYREAIDHLHNRGHEEPGDLKQNQHESVTLHDSRVLFKRAFQPIFKRHGLLTAAPVASALTVVVLTEIKHDESHVHPPEKKESPLVRRQRRHRPKEHLIANLYPLIKKIKPLRSTDTLDSCLDAVNRLLMFPSGRQAC